MARSRRGNHSAKAKGGGRPLWQWAAAVGVYLSGLALWSAYSCQSPGLAQRVAFPFFLMPFALALFVGA